MNLKEKKSKSYSRSEWEQILSMTDNYRTLLVLEDYMKKYPLDVNSKLYYAKVLIGLGKLEMALEVLNSELVLSSKRELDNEQRLFSIAKILIAKEKYQECYDLIQDNNLPILKIYYKDAILLFLKKKLNILTDEDIKNSNGYLKSQIISYREDVALAHILRHKSLESDKETCSQFSLDFPLDKFYHQVKNLIPNINKINSRFIINIHVFKYNRVGIVSGELVDYIKVATIANSNHILSMYPCQNEEKFPYIDLNYDLIEEDKVKKISQIDKFNKRYRR